MATSTMVKPTRDEEDVTDEKGYWILSSLGWESWYPDDIPNLQSVHLFSCAKSLTMRLVDRFGDLVNCRADAGSWRNGMTSGAQLEEAQLYKRQWRRSRERGGG